MYEFHGFGRRKVRSFAFDHILEHAFAEFDVKTQLDYKSWGKFEFMFNITNLKT